MRDIKIASRYAKSLLKIAIDEKALEELHNDMQLVNDVCNSNHDLILLLKSPIVKSDKKKDILENIFEKSISKIANSFINIIVSKKREGILNDIATSFIDIYKLHKNIETATVTSAIPLSKEQREQIISLIGSIETSSVDLREIVDNDIIGGMILRVGDKQVDESIKRKLMNLEMEFDENPYIKEF